VAKTSGFAPAGVGMKQVAARARAIGSGGGRAGAVGSNARAAQGVEGANARGSCGQ